MGHHSDAEEGPKMREGVTRLLSQELHLLPEAAEKRKPGRDTVQDRQPSVANPGRLVIPRDVLVHWASEKS